MENRQKLVYAVIFIAVIILIGGYFYFWKSPVDEKKTEEEVVAPSKASAPAVSGTLPSINTQTNVLEKVPEINPVDKVNPFKDVYKNPFE